MRKLAIFLVLLVVSISKADIREFLDNSVILIESNPSTLQTDTRSVYFGGGYKLKTPSTMFQPFTVIPPSFKAGCGGIDLTFGAFSYFNVEYLVSFLKAVAAQAPAFAFKTAIQTLCPQCDQQMNNLTALANAINGLNFNSCQTLQILGNKWLGSNLNRTIKDGATGPDWLKSFNDNVGKVADFIDNMKDWFYSQGCDPDDRRCYANFIYASEISLLQYLMKDIPYVNSDANFQRVLRALIGDIIKKGGSGEDRIKGIYVPAVVNGSLIKTVLSGMAIGNVSCDDSWYFEYAMDEYGNTVPAKVKTLCSYVQTNVESIISKIKSREPLDNTELKFLSMFRIPVYQLFNTLSMQPDALEGAKAELVKYLTNELLYDVLSSVLSNYSALLSRLKNANDDKVLDLKNEDIRQIQNKISDVLSFSLNLVAESRDKFASQIDMNFKVKKLRAIFMANLSRHPVVSSSFYSKSLLGF